MTGSDLPALLEIRIGGKFDCNLLRDSVKFMNGMLYVSAPLLTDLLIIYHDALFYANYQGKEKEVFYFEGTSVWEFIGVRSPNLGRTGSQKLKTN